MDKKYLDKFVDQKYFEYPKPKIKSFFVSKKIHYIKQQIINKNPSIFVCSRFSEADYYLLNQTLVCDYVILKNDYVEQIYLGTLPENDKIMLMKQFNLFKFAMISVVIFPDLQQSIFGESQKLSTRITEFLYETKMNMQFISFTNSYFAKPIWANNTRKTGVYLNFKFKLSNSLLSTLSADERNKKINHCIPSSASVYAKKNNAYVRGKNLATGLDKLIFACPACGELFSIKSEFNQLRCAECGVPFEMTSECDFYLNGKTVTFDDIKYFLDSKTKILLENKKFSFRQENITLTTFLSGVAAEKFDKLTLEYTHTRLKFGAIAFEKNIHIKDIITLEFLPKNIIKLTLKNNEVYEISLGDNLYIIYSLIKTKID